MSELTDEGLMKVSKFWLFFWIVLGLGIGVGISWFGYWAMDYLERFKGPSRVVERMEALNCVAREYQTTQKTDLVPACGPTPGAELGYGLEASWPNDACYAQMQFEPQRSFGVAMQILPLPGEDFLIIGIGSGNEVFLMRREGFFYRWLGTDLRVYDLSESLVSRCSTF